MKQQIFHLVVLLLLLISVFPVQAENVKAGTCHSYKTNGNKVVFFCDNNIQVEILKIESGILKIWYDTDGFKRDNKSFAVIKKGESKSDINVTELPGSYEIYTGDLIVRIEKSPFQIRIFDKYQKLLMEDFQDRGFVADTIQMTSSKTLKPGERIYGLGEKNGSLNRVGSRFKMWNSDKPCYATNEDPLYKSIPFFMSSSGYGIFFDNTYKTEYDFGVKSNNYYSFSAPGGEMEYYFIYGPTFPKIIRGYMELTGQPIMPPAWALGFAQCRGLLTNEKLTREIAKGYRDRQIPCDIIYQDIGWTEYLQDFEWRNGNYDDPVKMLADLESEGFKVIVSQDPVISKANKKQWVEADSLGYFTTDVRTDKTYDMPWPWGGNCGVVDFTNPDVADWWGSYQQKALDAGVRGFWTDMGEPAWSNEESLDRLNMKHHMGMHNEIHNVYGLTWDKVVTEQFEKHNPNTRVFQMTRAAFAGMQRYTFGWSGDSGNGNDVTDGWKQMAAQLSLALSAGMCGIPFWATDISGYCGDITDYDAMAELYVRWLQFGAFNPLSRIHHEGNNAVEPWLFGEEAERIAKKTIELKYRLFPYIYTYAREAHDTGLPLMRALVLEYPDDPEVVNLSSEFLFGEEMLVAPVLEEGAAFRKVYLPEGKWIDFNHPKNTFDGKQWIDYPVELETIPIFVRKGAIVPQMPVMQFIGEQFDYPLLIEVFPADINKKAAFQVYEDDGETNNYKSDLYVQRKIQCLTKRSGIEIGYKEDILNGFKAQNRNLVYQVHMDKKPSSVQLSDKKLKTFRLKQTEDILSGEIEKAAWTWDKVSGTCFIRIPFNKVNEKIVIEN
ncbi:glycoside hydrolase family 31 protein [uncultured Draconibacterium sp.]|uniref:glycoside hydrolase family 31 protein n=1 Tax=uncultured Draconibacterium sp. TaxID=1573823 RepID=UPI0029C90711|nr:glycoside hydrolase family 31 protein [uncultured Draconibacterium sp.]